MHLTPRRPRWPSLPLLLTSILSLAIQSRAILVAPQSSCARYCGNNLLVTPVGDLVCGEDQYASTTAGDVFSGCVDCEIDSTWVYEEDGKKAQSDLQWMLYNVRLATSYCLFGIPGGTPPSNPCITAHACEPLVAAITYGNVSTTTANYDYCNSWNSDTVTSCEECLRAGERNILSNLITVLDAGCQQKPEAGHTVSIEGEVFSRTDIVNVTEPTPSLEASYDTTTGFPIGAKVGIAVGAVVFVLLVAGCCVVYIGKRRRRAFLRRLDAQKAAAAVAGEVPPIAFTDAAGMSAIRSPRTARPPTTVVTSWPAASTSTVAFGSTDRDVNETPLSQRPLRSWDDTTSPLSATTTAADRSPNALLPRYWSPYGSPVSPDDPRSAQLSPFTRASPLQPREIGLAFGGEDSSLDERTTPIVPGGGVASSQQGRKGKEKDAVDEYEMERIGGGKSAPSQNKGGIQ